MTLPSKGRSSVPGRPVLVNPCTRYGEPTEAPRGTIAYSCDARPACPTCGRVIDGVSHECNNFGKSGDEVA